MVNLVRIYPELRNQLHECLRLIGWKTRDFWEHCSLGESMSLAKLNRILKGELHREDEVYAVEWCIQKTLREVQEGELVGERGIVQLNLPHLHAVLVGDELRIRLFFAPAEETGVVREELKVVAEYINIQPWRYSEKKGGKNGTKNGGKNEG